MWLTHRAEGYCYRKQECTDQFRRLWSGAVEFENWPFFNNPAALFNAQCAVPESSLLMTRSASLRPPYFSYSDSTAQAYKDAGFRLILSDLSANDGFIYATSFRRRSHFFNRLLELHHRLASIRTIPNPLPIVVTLHDVNQFSAENMVEYLQILVEEARQAGFVITEKPFYDRTEDLQHALNVWWEFNEALRLDCNKITCPPIGTYLPNRRPGDVTKADGPSLVQ